MFLNPIKHVLRVFFERLQKHFTKRGSHWSPNKGSSCEGKILAYKKNKWTSYKQDGNFKGMFFPFSAFFVAVEC